MKVDPGFMFYLHFGYYIKCVIFISFVGSGIIKNFQVIFTQKSQTMGIFYSGGADLVLLRLLFYVQDELIIPGCQPEEAQAGNIGRETT